MADTTFVSKVTKIATAWLQDVNDLVYLKPGTILDNLWAWIQSKLASPGAIGGTTPAAITGTTITATGTMSAAAASAAGHVPRADQIQAHALTYGVTGGTNTAFTLTLSPVMAVQNDGAEVDVKFHLAAGTTPTLSVNGMAARPLKYFDNDGVLQDITSDFLPINWRAKCITDGTNWIVQTPRPGRYTATSTYGYGLFALSSGTQGIAVYGYSSSYYALVAATGGNSRAALRITPQSAQPSDGQVGDIYVTTAGVLKICTVAGTPGTWVSVGTQT